MRIRALISSSLGAGSPCHDAACRDRQVLMIANEMHRGSRLEEPEALRRCYERS